MGIYFDRGLVYYVIVSDDIHIPFDYTTRKFGGNKIAIEVLSTADTNTRLLKTKYYKSQSENWFHPLEFIKRVDLENDIELTDSEKSKLNYLLNDSRISKSIIEHGWYDRNSLSSTYSL